MASIQNVVREVARKVLDLSGFDRICERVEDPRVLDVATGNGTSAFEAASRLGKTRGKVVATDFAEGMIAAVRAKIESEGWPNVEGVIMDAQALSLPDANFHLVTCQFGIMFFPEPLRAVREMVRVLKPRGQCVIATWAKNEAADIILAAAADLQPEDPPTLVGRVPFNFDEPEKIELLLSEAGFDKWETHRFDVTFNFADVDELWKVFESNPITTDIVAMLHGRSKEDLGEAVMQRLKAAYPSGGPLVLDKSIYIVAVAEKGRAPETPVPE